MQTEDGPKLAAKPEPDFLNVPGTSPPKRAFAL